jgi:DUF4097 and DUF4098 domain-containing protein YvlB
LIITNNNGRVTASTTRGPARVRNSFGEVQLRGIGGDVEVQSGNGAVRVSDIHGGLTIRNSFGDVEALNVQGSANVDSGNAAVVLRDVTGAAEIRNQFGRVEARKIGQGVRVFGANGDVAVSDAGGSVYVKTSFGQVLAERVGALTVDSANGAVRASAIKGGVELKTSFAPATVAGVEGPVDVRNQNGSIDVSGIVPAGKACPRITLATSFAPMRVTLPEGVGFNITARTSFGKISSRVPLTTTGIISGESLSGTIGGGGCEVTLTNRNGDITLGSGLAPTPAR